MFSWRIFAYSVFRLETTTTRLDMRLNQERRDGRGNKVKTKTGFTFTAPILFKRTR